MTDEFSGTWSNHGASQLGRTVTPSKGKYIFTPDHYSYTNVTVNKTGQDFTASLP